MARPCNAPMWAWFKKMNKDWLIRLLVDEIQNNRKLQEENEMLKCKGWTPEKVWHEEMIQYLMEENKKMKEILSRIKELYEDEEEAELLNYLDENLDEI